MSEAETEQRVPLGYLFGYGVTYAIVLALAFIIGYIAFDIALGVSDILRASFILLRDLRRDEIVAVSGKNPDRGEDVKETDIG